MGNDQNKFENNKNRWCRQFFFFYIYIILDFNVVFVFNGYFIFDYILDREMKKIGCKI